MEHSENSRGNMVILRITFVVGYGTALCPHQNHVLGTVEKRKSMNEIIHRKMEQYMYMCTIY